MLAPNKTALGERMRVRDFGAASTVGSGCSPDLEKPLVRERSNVECADTEIQFMLSGSKKSFKAANQVKFVYGGYTPELFSVHVCAVPVTHFCEPNLAVG